MNNSPKDWPLVDPCDDGIRPAGPTDECFYCNQKVGQPHRRSCVIVKKLVRFRCTIDLDIDVPHSWTKEQIQDYYGPYSDQVWAVFDSFSRMENPDSYGCEYVGIVDETPRRKLKNRN